ncbi:Uncharacterized protein GBIM_05281 [Gryllus bimaculatus]|nr:Uncharacterized protein GBIM_05281 [Gryllus bimaculatus]
MVLADSNFHKGLVFLFRLAWDCRFRLPLLITIGFMVLDVRMQLEINVDVDPRNPRGEEEADGEDSEEYSSNSVSITDDDDYLSSYEETDSVG